MIPETQRKLNEALFFFKLLYGLTQGPDYDQEEFGYYLSAFLSAARSVTWVLQVEDKDHYDAWYPGWEGRLAEADHKLWRFMNDQRVAEVHQDGANLDTTLEWRPVRRVFGMPGRALAHSIIIAPPGSPPVQEGVPIHRFRIGDSAVDVRDACATYLNLLKALVREFIAVHTTGVSSSGRPVANPPLIARKNRPKRTIPRF
jgi:hypothetical protein